MKTLNPAILLTLACLTSSRAEEARFFRVVGPVAATITALRADGYMTWTNVPTNATFTVQTASSVLSPTNWADYLQVPATSPVTTQRLFDPNPPAGMALIPASSFKMGNAMSSSEGDPDERPLHSLYVSAFYMDRYHVTKALWDEVYNWATNHGYRFDYRNSGQGKRNNHPAQMTTWYDAVKWCNARSEKEGRTPAYYTSAAQTVTYRTGTNDLQTSFVNWSTGYRLPTEAEWEKAARGGASGQRFPWGNTISWSHANYYAYPLSAGGWAYDVNLTVGFHPSFNDGIYPYTSPVDYFAPNGYGLYDMAGNVAQWCWDWYGAYSASAQTDPRGPATGSERVLRGGGWGDYARDCRSAYRIASPPNNRQEYGGFRSVLPPGQ